MIVITTPSGLIGRQVLGNVLNSGKPIRVIVRDPSRLPSEARKRIDVVQGSHGVSDTVQRAFAGADTVFWLVPPDPKAESVEAAYVGFSRPACAAFKSQGVKRVVGISALGRGTPWAGERWLRHGVAQDGRSDREHGSQLPRSDQSFLHGQSASSGASDQEPRCILLVLPLMPAIERPCGRALLLTIAEEPLC